MCGLFLGSDSITILILLLGIFSGEGKILTGKFSEYSTKPPCLQRSNMLIYWLNYKECYMQEGDYVYCESDYSLNCSVHENGTSWWLVHISHCEADQVGSLSVNPVAVDGPGSIGDTWSLWIVHICLIIV